MPDENVKPPDASSAGLGGLDSPAPGQCIFDESIFLSGWFDGRNRDPSSSVVRAYVDDVCCGETRIIFPRADARHGFRILGKIPAAANEMREATLRVVASWGDGTSSTLAETP